MSDDVLFVAAGSAGTLFGLWRLMAGRLPAHVWSRVLAVVGLVLFGSLAVGGVQSVLDGGGFADHRADLGAGALLLVVMGMPLWGFVDERLLARVGEVSVASVGLAAGYQVAEEVDRSAGLVIATLSLAVAWSTARSVRGGWRLAGYGWFLAATVVLAVVEADGSLEPLTSEIVEVEPGPVFAGFAAMLWLSFHAVFATKFVLILATCARREGRALATRFAERVVVRRAHGSGAVVLLAVEAAVLVSDAAYDWANNLVVVAVVIFALPLAEEAWVSRPSPDGSR